MQVIAIANLKGGVGKTTTALNLGYCLAEMRRRTLLVDLDPQSSLTAALTGEQASQNMANVLGDAASGRLTIHEIVKHIVPGLDLAPSGFDLGISELGIVTRYARESILKKALQYVKSYDVCLIDCGPSLGMLAVNALAAANGLIIPTLPTALDLLSLSMFLERGLEPIRRELNPSLSLIGVLVCQYDSRLKLHQAAVKDMRSGGLPLFDVMISKSVRTATATGEGKPIKRGDLAGQYEQLAGEVEAWLKKKQT